MLKNIVSPSLLLVKTRLQSWLDYLFKIIMDQNVCVTHYRSMIENKTLLCNTTCFRKP